MCKDFISFKPSVVSGLPASQRSRRANESYYPEVVENIPDKTIPNLSSLSHYSTYDRSMAWIERTVNYAEKIYSSAEKTCRGCSRPSQSNPTVICVGKCKSWLDKNKARKILKDLNMLGNLESSVTLPD